MGAGLAKGGHVRSTIPCTPLWQDMLSARHVASALAGATDQGAAQSVPGRTVLLVGEAARQRACILVETMRACNCQPVIVAALVPKHLGETLKGAAERVRCGTPRCETLQPSSDRIHTAASLQVPIFCDLCTCSNQVASIGPSLRWLTTAAASQSGTRAALSPAPADRHGSAAPRCADRRNGRHEPPARPGDRRQPHPFGLIRWHSYSLSWAGMRLS